MLSLMLLAATATADLAALDRAAEIFTGARFGEPNGPVTPIDPRLKLAQCTASPVYAWRSERHDAITISCPDPNGWRLFMAVKTEAQPAAAAAPVKAEPVIRRGDPVSIVAQNAGFSVSTDGVAMGDAAPGARLLIKVDGAKNPVQAIAVEAGKAALPGS